MGLHFHKSYHNEIAHSQDFNWGSENLGIHLHHFKFNKVNVSVHFRVILS